MSAEHVVIKIDVKANTRAIDRVRTKLAALAAEAEALDQRFGSMTNRFEVTSTAASKLTDTLGDVDGEIKQINRSSQRSSRSLRQFGRQATLVDRAFGAFGSTLHKVVATGLKVFAINVGLAGVALAGIIGAFAVGRFAVQAWQGTLQVAAVAAASVAATLATAAAAQRQYTAALVAYQYKAGSGPFSGFRESSTALRSLQNDSTLASFGLQSLNATFSAVSQNSEFTANTLASLRGLGDFAVTTGDPGKGLQAAGVFLGMLQKEGKLTEDVLTAAGELGPQLLDALTQAQKQGIDTASEIMTALANGQISALGGLTGQLDTVNSTLFAQLKGYATEAVAIFTDMGEPMLGSMQDGLRRIMQILRRTIVQISDDVQRFGQGTFVDGLVGGVDKIAQWSVDLFEKYLPKAEGMIGRIREVFRSIQDGWEKMVDWLRPLQEGGRVLTDAFGPVFEQLVSGFGGGMQQLNRLLIDNQDEVQAFGQSLVRLLQEIGRVFGELKEALFALLPAITTIVEQIANLVGTIADLMNALNNGGGIGSGIIAALGMGGLMVRGNARNRMNGRPGARGLFPTYGTGGTPGMGRTPGMGGFGMFDPRLALAMLGGNVALQAQTLNGAMGGGIAAGVSIGSMFGPPGALLGLLGGAAAGGLSYMFREPGIRDRRSGEFADERVGESVDAIVARMLEGDVGRARAEVGEFRNRVDRLRELSYQFADEVTTGPDVAVTVGRNYEGMYNNVGMAAKPLDEMVESVGQRFVEMGLITEAELKGFENDVDGFVKKLEGMADVLDEATRGPFDRFEALTGDLSKITGLSADRVNDLAQAMGVNLADTTLTLADAMSQLGYTMKDAAEMSGGLNDILASGLSLFDESLRVLNAPQVIDQAGEAMRQLGANATISDWTAFQQTQLEQAMIQNSTNPFAGLTQFRDYTSPTSYQFAEGLGGPLAGMRDNYQATGAAAQADKVYAQIRNDMLTTLARDLSTNLAGQGVVTSAPQIATQLASLTDQQLTKFYADVTARGATMFAGATPSGAISTTGATTMQRFGEYGLDISAVTQNTDGLAKAGEKLSSAAAELQSKIMAAITAGFARKPGWWDGMPSWWDTPPAVGVVSVTRNQPAINRNASTVSSSTTRTNPSGGNTGSDRPGGTAGVFGSESTDTRTPRAIGDATSSRLTRTLTRHSWLTSQVAGTRTITSAWRDHSLGSLNSDHLTGNAYDLTGQNLVGYRDLVNSTGGFAEFHGNGKGRHLHVVPGDVPAGDTRVRRLAAVPSAPIPIGDTGVRSFASTPAPAAAAVTNSYSFVINGSGMNPQQVAEAVMERLDRRERTRRERS